MIRKLFIYLIALSICVAILFGAGYLTYNEYLKREDAIKFDFNNLIHSKFFYYESSRTTETTPPEDGPPEDGPSEENPPAENPPADESQT